MQWEQRHWVLTEGLNSPASINALFQSCLKIVAKGFSRIQFDTSPKGFDAVGSAHGMRYSKMICNEDLLTASTRANDQFLLMTAFKLHFSWPLHANSVLAKDSEVGRGTGSFQGSRVPIATQAGYAPWRQS